VQAKTVDVLGVITYTSDTESIKLKDGTMKDKKTVVLADQSMCSISITIWGEEPCRSYQFTYGQVVAFKGARISEYNGKSLNAESKQGIFIKVDHPDVTKVKHWFEQLSDE
jgi:replication factor A1